MDRRNLLKGASSAVAASALTSRLAQSREADGCGRVAKPATFVLVPGAWCGGWVYDQVAEILRRRGHRVFALTLTGLGERVHLTSANITLDTHISDITNVFKYEQLEGVVLAGHSYGGVPITGAADRIADKISSLVYLDAMIPEDGQTVGEVARGGGPVQPPPPGTPAFPMPTAMMDMFGIPESQRWRYTTSPTSLAMDPIRLTGAWKSIGTKTFLWASKNELPTKASYELVKNDPAWHTMEIATRHMMMIDEPELTARILEDAISTA
jgi:pimeloyl-ACP methyl ester carboxylesterase